ncbi:GNAT family N-acetyltransferase [Streptosporangium sp. NPDC002544]|uniref:GNAT family N-acetyltransferase n=1 Tax=Streptosporangium sp. NPDC002544 TaxID=3154538 RepID=UPI00332A8350
MEIVTRRVRQAVPLDAAPLGVIQAASWQAAFHGLMPGEYLANLDTEAFQKTWANVIAESQWPSSGALVAEEADRVVGYSRFYPTDDADDDPTAVGMIGSIYTLPEVWGTGVGKALMAEVVDNLARAGYAEATLWVLEGNDRAQDFYRGQGWSKDGGMVEDRSDGFLITKVRYRRPLSI